MEQHASSYREKCGWWGSSPSTQKLLDNYKITINGFLPKEEPLRRLPEKYVEWENIVQDLVELNEKKETRNVLDTLPLLDVSDLEDERELRRAYLILSLFAHSYIWVSGEKNPATILPANLAVPWDIVSNKLGIRPMLTHAALDLYNWKLKDPNGDIELDNLEILHTMTGTKDEEWFYLVMTAIEKAGAEAMETFISMNKKIAINDDYCKEDTIRDFRKIERIVYNITQILNRMYENCTSKVFYNQLRPFLSGWTDKDLFPKGLEYENVGTFRYNGGSAAQSSLIQVFDTALGVEHKDPHGKEFLLKMRDYMPKKHNEFLQFMQEYSLIRWYVQVTDDDDVTKAYNDCIEYLARFRNAHIRMVHHYILVHVDNDNDVKGTGGTDLVDFLTNSRDDTVDCEIEMEHTNESRSLCEQLREDYWKRFVLISFVALSAVGTVWTARVYQWI